MGINEDALVIRKLMDAFANDGFVMERTRDNVMGPAPLWSQEQFWCTLMGCLLTTQQKSTTGMPVSRFLSTDPFPLSLSACRAHPVLDFVRNTLTAFGGIRFTTKIAWQAKENLERLEKGDWAKVEKLFARLKSQRERDPQPSDKASERDAARFVDDAFLGFGPKQARNLWQWLRLTRYEIPLDSRVSKFVNDHLSLQMDVSKLGYADYYESCLDHIQGACAAAGVLPCVFDAAAFNDENKPVTTGKQVSVTSSSGPRGTTVPGFVNANGQITIRDTGLAGTDHLQRVYQVACSHCGCIYGANGSDLHDRKCPACQSGSAGLPLGMKAHA